MHFGAVRALAGVSFVARDGAITGLVGENGAGKTTTLNIVSGLHEPMRGTVTIDNSPAGDPVARGFTGNELTQRVQRALAAVGIEWLAQRPTQGFSQGERMKVALARAIVHEPRTVILDEPANGLDVPSARAFKAALARMCDLGVCIVFSSHLIHDVSALCDSVVIILRGRTVAQGEPATLCREAGFSMMSVFTLIAAFTGGMFLAMDS